MPLPGPLEGRPDFSTRNADPLNLACPGIVSCLPLISACILLPHTSFHCLFLTPPLHPPQWRPLLSHLYKWALFASLTGVPISCIFKFCLSFQPEKITSYEKPPKLSHPLEQSAVLPAQDTHHGPGASYHTTTSVFELVVPAQYYWTRASLASLSILHVSSTWHTGTLQQHLVWSWWALCCVPLPVPGLGL
jgi:hypothetical protein